MKRCGNRAFSLIELLAVVLIILVLAAMSLGVSGYVQKRMASLTAKTQISALESALEAYKADNGYYPGTCACRISATMFCEATNNWILYQALSGVGGRKQYMKFPVSQLRPNPAGSSNIFTGAVLPAGVSGLTNFCDPWGIPYNYYCSPSTVYSNVLNAHYTLGGQVNAASFDLLSYGPDHFTYIPKWNIATWTNQSAALDDISNFGK